MSYLPVPGHEEIVAMHQPWFANSDGLPERYRVAFGVGFLLAGVGGLVVLAHRIRNTEHDTDDAEISRDLHRPDLLEGGEPANWLEWLIQVANRPETYAATIVSMLVLGLLGVIFDVPTVTLSVFFGILLFSTKAFLEFGWPYVERFYDRREPDERDPESLRFQGFSTDMKIILTLLAASFLAVMGLVALETMLG